MKESLFVHLKGRYGQIRCVYSLNGMTCQKKYEFTSAIPLFRQYFCFVKIIAGIDGLISNLKSFQLGGFRILLCRFH